MGLFSKAEYIETVLPFVLEKPSKEDLEACVIFIEAQGIVLDTMQYFYIGFDLKNVDAYDDLIKIIATQSSKKVKIIAKVKNGEVKKIKIDFDDLSVRFDDTRLKGAEIVGYGIHNESKAFKTF